MLENIEKPGWLQKWRINFQEEDARKTNLATSSAHVAASSLINHKVIVSPERDGRRPLHDSLNAG